MADLLRCTETEPHAYHGWDESFPSAPLGKHFHVCPGLEPEPPDTSTET